VTDRMRLPERLNRDSRVSFGRCCMVLWSGTVSVKKLCLVLLLACVRPRAAPLAPESMSDNEDDDQYTYESDAENVEYAYSSHDEQEDEDGEEKMNGTNPHENKSLFHVPDDGYKVLLYKDIQPMMESYTQEISQLFSIESDIANILLRKYKWNKEKLIDSYYANTEQILADAGVSPSPSSSSSSSTSSASSTSLPIRCRICGDLSPSDECYGLHCGHQFCRSCYATYLDHQIKDGPSCVHTHCPEYQCKQAMTIHAVFSLCSLETYERYMMYLTRNFIETSSCMRWCPHPGCDCVAIGSGITTVLCQCNLPYCFRCGQEAHDPATCAHLLLWQEKCNNESETANWILANTKKCPKCQTRIEKNQGCNHMNCKMCKYEFCWICMGVWSDHGQNTGGYYKCNKYDPKSTEDNSVEKAKAELDR
jgi:ariadne-1